MAIAPYCVQITIQSWVFRYVETMKSVVFRVIAGIVMGSCLLSGCSSASNSAPSSNESCVQFDKTSDELTAARDKNTNAQTVLALAYFYVNDSTGCATAKEKAQAQADITMWSENK